MMKLNSKILWLVVLLVAGTSMTVFAQETVAPDAPQDSSYENEISKPTKLLQQELNNPENKPEDANNDASKINKVSELGELVPFSDIAVIQKKYLPKTGRFEFFPNLGFVTNNAFFLSTFLQTRLAYGLTETWALEATAAVFNNSDYRVTKELKDQLNVDTQSHLLTKGYYGLDAKWSPIYGKMGIFSDGIMPFDIYFSAGFGEMKTNQSTSPMALHLGAGQIFAINKWMAFRWDISGYFYSSDTHVTANSSGVSHESFQDIQLGLGLSFFFPEAKYR